MPIDLKPLGLGALSDPSQREDWLRSLARAHATVLGAPVDTLNAGMGLLGLPVSGRPVMGSQWIAENTGAPSQPGSPYADFAVGLLAQPVAQAAAKGAGLLSDAVMSAKRGPVPGGPASQEGALKLLSKDSMPSAAPSGWSSRISALEDQIGRWQSELDRELAKSRPGKGRVADFQNWIAQSKDDLLFARTQSAISSRRNNDPEFNSAIARQLERDYQDWLMRGGPESLIDRTKK